MIFFQIDTPSDRHLPSREISYAYTVAMHFAQQFELDLRAFIHTMDYHGWLPEVPLSDEQKKRFKDFDGFIDKSTCGSLIEVLCNTSIINNKQAFKVFRRACEHRNHLAHSYLTEQDFDHMTATNQKAIIHELGDMAGDLFRVLQISRAIRDRAEARSDEQHEISKKQMEEMLGIINWEAPGRKYIYPKKHSKARRKTT